jgi:glycerol-3-phosphate cytidylyltransferase
MKIVITFGTYDLLHIGHIMILKRAKDLGDKLIVGVSSDKFNMLKKNKIPVYNENDRIEIIKSIKYVDEVFLEESFEQKRDYIKKYNADILVMGSDWSGKFDEFNDICKIKILDRTENISTTEIVQKIKN